MISFCEINFDFVFTDYRKRRVIIDFEGDRPENDGGCDLSDVKTVTYTLIDDPEGDVYVGDGKLEFGDTLYGVFKDLGEIKVKRAFFVTFAYTYGSEELLCDCEAKKK